MKRYVLVVLFFLSLSISRAQSTNKSVSLYHGKVDVTLQTLNLETFQNEFTGASQIKTVTTQDAANFNFETAAPVLLRFYSLKPQGAPVVVYAQPGDSISYKPGANGLITFEGKNAACYNFFNLFKNEAYYYPAFDEVSGLQKYKEQTTKIYNKKMALLRAYAAAENVPQNFAARAADVLQYEYINALLGRLKIPEAALKANPSYLNDFDIKLFQRNDQADNNFFYLAMANYLHFYALLNEPSEGYSIQKLRFLLRYIESNLAGDVQEFAITKTLSEYENHLAGKGLIALKPYVANALATVNGSGYKMALEQINHRLQTLSEALPAEVLAARLVTPEGETVTLSDVLKQCGNKVKVIDFWASWCGPCINEIKNSHVVREKMAAEKNMVFLYLSVDSNEQKWRNKISGLKSFGMDKNQYLISGPSKEVLRNYFSLSTIPKYAVLDQTNNVFINAAPSPGSADFNVITSQLR